MNELKPEDVMKALECCGNSFGCHGNECPYYETKGDCIRQAMKSALALLCEKDAEIERLNALNKVLKDNNHQCHRLGYEDAITEFAERLKTFYKHLPGNTVGGAVEYHIDQIAKEMKEGRG